jgi:uncharacterized protein YaiE (UPF0345 family)
MKHSSYFDGKVQSLGLNTPEGYATAGVIEPGKYTFKTDAEEHMHVVAGTLKAKLPVHLVEGVSPRASSLWSRPGRPLMSKPKPTWPTSAITKSKSCEARRAPAGAHLDSHHLDVASC